MIDVCPTKHIHRDSKVSENFRVCKPIIKRTMDQVN